MQFVSEVWSVSKGQIFPLIICAWPGLCQHLAWRGDVWWEDPPGHRHLMGEHTLPWWRWWDESLQKQDLYYSCKAMSAKLNFKFVCRCRSFLPSFMWCLELLLKTFERGLISINSWNASFVKKISKNSKNGVRCSVLISSYCESCVYCKCVILIDN